MTGTELTRVGREVVRRGLTWGSAGNVSARLDDGRFLVTATGVRLDELAPADLVACRVDGPGWEGERRPSVEVEMHRAVYAAVPGARAVLHASAPATTLVACSRMRLPVGMSTDGVIYVGPVARVPYRRPGTPELARAAAAGARRSRVLLLSNHGSLVWGSSPDEVLTRTEALEFVARLVLAARSAGIPLAHLPAAEVASFSHRHRAPGEVWNPGPGGKS